jgi:hypothetical protein
MAYDRERYEKNECMGRKNVERKYGLEVEQGTWRIRTNQELWELYTYFDNRW